MNPEKPSREEIEIRLTAMLLGELPEDEVRLLRWTISQDPELGKLHDQLKLTIGLVREVSAKPAEPEALKLSEERRKKLLEHFQTPRVEESFWVKRMKLPSLIEVLAVLAIVAILAAMLLPALSRAKYRSKGAAQLAAKQRELKEELEQEDSLKQAPAPPTVTVISGRAVGQPMAGAAPEVFFETNFPTVASAPPLSPPPMSMPAPQPTIVLPTDGMADVPVETGPQAPPDDQGVGEVNTPEINPATGLPVHVPHRNEQRRETELITKEQMPAVIQEFAATEKANASNEEYLHYVEGYVNGNKDGQAGGFSDGQSHGQVVGTINAFSGVGGGGSGGSGGAGGGGASGGAGSENRNNATLALDDRRDNRLPAENKPATDALVLDPGSPPMGAFPGYKKTEADRTDVLSSAPVSTALAGTDSATGIPPEPPVGGTTFAKRLDGLADDVDEDGLPKKDVDQLHEVDRQLAKLKVDYSASNSDVIRLQARRDQLVNRIENPGNQPGQLARTEGNNTFSPGSISIDFQELSGLSGSNVLTLGDLLVKSPSRLGKLRTNYWAVSNQIQISRQKITAWQQKGTSVGAPAYINEQQRLMLLNTIKTTLETSIKTDSALEQQDVPLHKPTPNAPVPQPEVLTTANPFSTFAMNVSDVSFQLAAASLEKGGMPEAASIRSEEFINAFDYRDPEAAAGQPIAFTSERVQDPFAQNRDLLRFSIKTAVAGRQAGRPLNLVLLLDNSGSMERADRVAIIRESLRVLAAQLEAQDTITVVTFARTARLWLDGVPGNQAGAELEKVGELTPQGGTNLEEAMRLAYEAAHRHYLANGMNRVVLLTDGAANLGSVDANVLTQRVEENRKQGIALDCFGIGWEDFNDDLLEQLSSHGDGRYAFLNSPEQAASDFAAKLAGALQIAAQDVKVQVEFNPERVTAYRQIGYAKHQLTKEQFRDNSVAAGEIAAAEAGNALYTVALKPDGNGPLATVRLRYRVPGTTEYSERSWNVDYIGNAPALEKSSPAMRLSATAAGFAEWLGTSPYAQQITLDELLTELSGVPSVYGADARPKKLEWMIRQAKSVAGK